MGILRIVELDGQVQSLAHELKDSLDSLVREDTVELVVVHDANQVQQ